MSVWEYLEAAGLTGLGELHPFARDMLDFSEIVKEFVGKYVDLYYTTEADILSDVELQKFFRSIHVVPNTHFPPTMTKPFLKDLISNFVIHVTAIHNHVGNVAEYLLDARFASGKLRAHREISDVQANLQAMLIALMTGLKVPPLVNDYSHVYLHDHHFKETSELARIFVEKLNILADEIEARNKVRKFPTNSVNPRRLRSSVSI